MTDVLISIPVSKVIKGEGDRGIGELEEALGYDEANGVWDVPSISFSGNKGASAINSPPNPHPTSAHSTFFSPGVMLPSSFGWEKYAG